MAEKKKKKDEKEKAPPLEKPILKATGANKLLDAFKQANKAAETAKPVEIATQNMKRPVSREPFDGETLAQSIERNKLLEEEARKKAASKPKKLRE